MASLHTSDIKNILNSAGFRATKPRVTILEFLRTTKHPLSVSDVMNGIGKKNVDQVTIYRTLESFAEVGIVSQVDFKLGRTYYEIKDTSDHHHIVCTTCGTYEDFVGCDYKALALGALKNSRAFAKITNHSFEFFGICNECHMKKYA